MIFFTESISCNTFLLLTHGSKISVQGRINIKKTSKCYWLTVFLSDRIVDPSLSHSDLQPPEGLMPWRLSLNMTQRGKELSCTQKQKRGLNLLSSLLKIPRSNGSDRAMDVLAERFSTMNRIYARSLRYCLGLRTYRASHFEPNWICVSLNHQLVLDEHRGTQLAIEYLN